MLNPVVHVANHLLSRDEWARSVLRPHQGRIAELQALGVSIRFAIGTDGFLSAPPEHAHPDLQIEVPAEALAALPQGFSAVTRRALIRGNAEFAEAISSVMRELSPDPAEDLSRFVGNIAAQRAATGVERFVVVPRALFERSLQILHERSAGNLGPLVARDALNGFAASVDAIRDDMARLEARLRKFEFKI